MLIPGFSLFYQPMIVFVSQLQCLKVVVSWFLILDNGCKLASHWMKVAVRVEDIIGCLIMIVLRLKEGLQGLSLFAGSKYSSACFISSLRPSC